MAVLDLASTDRVPEAWMAKAACKGLTTVFFPPSAERPQARERQIRAIALAQRAKIELAAVAAAATVRIDLIMVAERRASERRRVVAGSVGRDPWARPCSMFVLHIVEPA